MSFDFVGGLGGGGGADVVDLKGEVVGDGREEGVVEGVEGDVVDDCVVGCVDCCGADFRTRFLEAVEVPKRQAKKLNNVTSDGLWCRRTL